MFSPSFIPVTFLGTEFFKTYGSQYRFLQKAFISQCLKKAKGKYKKRGETYVLITHRPSEKNFGVVSVRAGYAFKKETEATITIGKNSFRLFTDIGHAFAKDKKTDTALVKAMIRGANMVLRGTSSRGTKTTDTYSLKGVAASWKAINRACKAQ